MSAVEPLLPLLALPETSDALLPSEGAARLGFGPPYYLGTGLAALLLVVAHLSAPAVRRSLSHRSASVGSFGGGMAAAYVFLHLLPELDKGHELLGRWVFLIPLVGFSIYYTVHRVLHGPAFSSDDAVRASFVARLINLAVYNALVLYGGPGLGAEAGWAALPIALAILLHLAHLDLGVGEEFPGLFRLPARLVLAGACVLAYALLLLQAQPNEPVSEILVAFLAGSVLFTVFHQEVPDAGRSRIGWFLAGILVFAVCATPSLA